MNLDYIIDESKKLIKPYEGLKLTAYRCPRGVLTIGWGHTKGVKEGDVCTLEQAEQYLSYDINYVVGRLQKMIKVSMTDNQFIALISFTFNEGEGNFASSTLLKKLNKSDYSGASLEFARWNKTTIDGVLTVLDGLTKRRETERKIFIA